MAVRVYIVAVDSQQPCEIALNKRPGAKATAAIEELSFDDFLMLDSIGVNEVAAELCRVIARPDLVNGVECSR